MDSKELPPPYSPNMVPGVHQQQWQNPPGYPQAVPPNQGAYPYPPQGTQGGYPYPAQWQQQPYQSYGTATTAPPLPAGNTTTTVVMQPEVIVIGGCPACRIGVLEDNYGLCAICCAIVFFPAGILCCLLMKDRRCSHCGAVFD